MTTETVAQPTFPFSAYGVHLTDIGEDGGIMAEGHVPLRRFLAAANHFARVHLGLKDLIDGAGDVTADEMLAEFEYRWALPVPSPHPGESYWYVRYGSDVTGETPGALPVTLWLP